MMDSNLFHRWPQS